ncbi:ATP-binding protein [Parapedobacter sp. 10938]|uniref:ATP-binding protein n=1 Tax=Parapedobacter flavus TaxID=3110225 RepID=UPI002DB71B0C|nr:AAA family ATPase [Parapedobacter sp. 10938]MEC3878597.1 AAA family ATPase [Parapedobacter sp. 10938]
MHRNNIKSLIKWKLSKKRKPLVLLGARQVGKTYLLHQFGRVEYKQLAYINFEHPNAPKSLFQIDFDAGRIMTVLNAYCNVKINAEDTLIVFDEIQAAPKGLTALKYFYEDAPEYHIIGAGSLLGVNIHPDESFPVGKVDFMKLCPMNFHEFLLAMEETGMAEILEKRDLESLSFFHQKLINYLRYYLFVGGMPEAVSDFAENRDWQSVRRIQNQIIMSYRSDFSKHAPKEILPRINMVWDSMPAQLSKENKKFIYGVIKEGARAKDFELAIQWLTDAGLLHKVYNTSKAALPLVAYQELSAFKLFHNDVGLLGAMSRLNAKTVADGDAIFCEFKGALAEQFVFQQLNQNETLSICYHTFENSKYELDFLIQTENDEVIPIEVKAGENLKSNSFRLFCQKNKPKTAIRISLSDYKKEAWMTNIPLYGTNAIN